MTRRLGMAILGVVLLSLVGGILGAQEQAALKIPQRAIEIGQRMDVAAGILRDYGIEFDERVYAETKRGEDEASVTFTLDKEHAIARVHYSKSKRTVVDIWVAFRPTRASGKGDYVWLRAQSILPERDGSYRIHFSTPSEH